MTYPNATNYSAHFTRAELDCRCGCPTPPTVATNLQDTAVHLEELRRANGGPLHIDDAYRCPTRNTAVGGVKDSQHLLGKAVDVSAAGIGVAQLAKLAEEVPAFFNGGIGQYPGEDFVHVDWRVGAARWSG